MIAELFTSVDGLRDTRKRLRKWMRPQRRHVSVLFATGSNRVIPQPKGVIGVVSPWNYPLFLTASPLTSILAAGNRAMVKMATNSQHLCRLLAEKCRAVFPEDTVAFLPGVRAQDFSTLPYDHLIFTGSADAGRTVMRSAAENLTPVTLELGGKSPTVICEDFDVDEAASRILYAKCLNAGQTCPAPACLPVKTYRTLDEVIAYVNGRDRPLGFYVFTNDKAAEQKLLYSTISGGVSINNCMLHVAQHDMPFGGIGASGMGHYHGHEGFLEFSKLRPVFTNPRLSLLHLFYPPYTAMTRRLLGILIKYQRSRSSSR